MRSHNKPHKQQSTALAGPVGSGAKREDNGLVTTRGGSISGENAGGESSPAFVHVAPRNMPLPVLIAAPHAGCNYPAEIVKQMRDPFRSQLRLEDGTSALQIRKRDIDELIQTTWTDHRRIKNIRTICCANYKNILASTDAVNFGKDLVNNTITSFTASTPTWREKNTSK